MGSARRDRHDRGFTMVEVVVAMALFGILLSAGLTLLVRTTGVAGQNVRRTTAANLLAQQLEVARGTRPADIADGVTSTSTAVGGTTYTITQDTRYVSSADRASLCDGTAGSLLYKLVTVRVTWPGMQPVAPVRGDALRAVGVGIEGTGAERGALAVLVQDAAGNAVAGATVTLRPSSGSRVTDSAGCAVFVDLPPGRYAADAVSADTVRRGSSGSRSVTAGGISQQSVTVHGPPPPPPPPTTPPPAPVTTAPPAPTTPPPAVTPGPTGPTTPASTTQPTDPFGAGGGTGPTPPAPTTTTTPPGPTTTAQPTTPQPPDPPQPRPRRPRQAS